MKNLLKTIQLGVLGAAAAILLTPATAAEPVSESARLHQMARQAETESEHVEVAKRFRLQGEAMEAKAAQHEKQAREFEARPKSALAHKWPAMAPQTGRQERGLAVQSRRAAREAFELAAKHVQLALEARHAAADAGN